VTAIHPGPSTHSVDTVRGARAAVYIHQRSAESDALVMCELVVEHLRFVVVEVRVDLSDRRGLGSILTTAGTEGISVLVVPSLDHLPDQSPEAIEAIADLGLQIITPPRFRGLEAFEERRRARRTRTR
jgi:hypothetical protein